MPQSQPTSGDFGGGTSGRERWPLGKTSPAGNEPPREGRSSNVTDSVRIRGSWLTSSIGKSVGPQPQGETHATPFSSGIAADLVATSCGTGFFREQHPPALTDGLDASAEEFGRPLVEQQPPGETAATRLAQQHVFDCRALWEQRHHGVAAAPSDCARKLQSPTGMPMLDAMNDINTSSRTPYEPPPFPRSKLWRKRFIAKGISCRRFIEDQVPPAGSSTGRIVPGCEVRSSIEGQISRTREHPAAGIISRRFTH